MKGNKSKPNSRKNSNANNNNNSNNNSKNSSRKNTISKSNKSISSSRKNSLNNNNNNNNNNNILNEYNLIRINSIENIPSPIENMSVLNEYNLLCLCRSDNSIELWTTNSWIQLLKIPGNDNIQTRKIKIIYKNKNNITINNNNNINFNNIKIFTIGLSGYFIEWDLINLKAKFIYNNNHAIWDFAFIKQKICLIASDDGIVRAIQIKKNQNPILLKTFEKLSDKILSICIENNNNNNNIFYCGLANGSIIKFNYNSNSILLIIKNYDNEINKNLIWSLLSINSNYLACGTSNGKILIFDVNFGVIFKDFHEHSADILTIASKSNEENFLMYFSGSDSLIIAIKYVKKNNMFIYLNKFRGQSHDINSLVYLDNFNVLLSGGINTDICIYKLGNKGNFLEKYEKKVNTNVKRHISPFEHRLNYFFSDFINEKFFLVLLKKNDFVSLYKINVDFNNNFSNDEINFMAKIYKNKKFSYKIISSNISKNGKFIAISYEKFTVLFKYDYEKNNIKKIKKINYLSNFIYFNKNNDKIILICQNINKIIIININNFNIENEISINNNNNNNNSNILLACEFNTEKNFLCISNFEKNLIFINLNNNNIEILSPPNKYITKINFDNKNNKIIIIDENNLIYFINLNNFLYDKWTEERILKNDYPKNYLKWYNKIFGIRQLKNNIYILFTDYNYIKLDVSKEIPENSLIEKNKMDKYLNSNWDRLIKNYHENILNKEYKGKIIINNNNNNENVNLINDNFKITSRFNSIMDIEILNNILIVIENDWNKIVESFPSNIVAFNYGH